MGQLFLMVGGDRQREQEREKVIGQTQQHSVTSLQTETTGSHVAESGQADYNSGKGRCKVRDKERDTNIEKQ